MVSLLSILIRRTDWPIRGENEPRLMDVAIEGAFEVAVPRLGATLHWLVVTLRPVFPKSLFLVAVVSS